MLAPLVRRGVRLHVARGHDAGPYPQLLHGALERARAVALGGLRVGPDAEVLGGGHLEAALLGALERVVHVHPVQQPVEGDGHVVPGAVADVRPAGDASVDELARPAEGQLVAASGMAPQKCTS